MRDGRCRRYASESASRLVRALRSGDTVQLVSTGDGSRAYARVGRTTEARAVLARLERDWGDTGFGNFAMPAIHDALDEPKPAREADF